MVEKVELLSILYRYYPKRVSARFLSGFIPGGATKSEVNSVLYSNSSDFCVDAAYNWQLTLTAYETMKKQMQTKEMKINELCNMYKANRFVVQKLLEVDYQLFDMAYSHAVYLAKCGNEIPYLLPNDWLRLVKKNDTLFYQEVDKLKEKQAVQKMVWHNKFEKEMKIRNLCSANGISEKSCQRLFLCPPYEVERRINEIKAFMKKAPWASVSISQAVLLNKEQFMNYKNTFRLSGTSMCTIECISCKKQCRLR